MSFSDRENKRSGVVSRMIENQPEKNHKKETSKNLIQRGYYLTPEIASKVKVKAAIEGKKDYQIVQEALERYLD